MKAKNGSGTRYFSITCIEMMRMSLGMESSGGERRFKRWIPG